MKLNVPVIGILRGIEGGLFQDVMQTSFTAGLEAVEITMNTFDAPGIINRCRSSVPPGKWLGAGTVRNLEEAEAAADAGATAVGVGQAFFGKKALKKWDMNTLSGNVKKFIELCMKSFYQKDEKQQK